MNHKLAIGALLTVGVAVAGYYGVAKVDAEPAATRILLLQPPMPNSEFLAWQDIVKPSDGKLGLSDKVRGLSGHRVRMTGFMAKLELPPKGGFYLTAPTVHGDESGAGTGDLPLDSVLVLSRSVTDRPIEAVDGPVEVTGTLEIGNREDSEGRANWLRLRLDPLPSP